MCVSFAELELVHRFDVECDTALDCARRGHMRAACIALGCAALLAEWFGWSQHVQVLRAEIERMIKAGKVGV